MAHSFLLVFALYIVRFTGRLLYSQLSWHIFFSVVFALCLYNAIFISTGRLLYSQLSWHILFLESSPFILFLVLHWPLYSQLSWRIPFFLVSALYIVRFTGRLFYSQLSWHIFFSVVFALFIILFSFPLAVYYTLNCHGTFCFLSLHPLYCFLVLHWSLYSQLSWRIPFFLVFALYIVRFTGRLFYFLNCRGTSLSLSSSPFI